MNRSNQYEVVGRERQMAAENDVRGRSGAIPGQFDHPVTLERVNRYGFIVVTKHHSRQSYDLTKAEVI